MPPRIERWSNEELQPSRRNPVLDPKDLHEVSEFVIGQSGMVLDLLDLGPRREQFVEMARPACRVFAHSAAADGGPIEDSFNSPSHSARCFRLGLPDRLQRLHDERDIDCLHRQGTEDRAPVAAQCVAPLARCFALRPLSSCSREIRALISVHGWVCTLMEFAAADSLSAMKCSFFQYCSLRSKLATRTMRPAVFGADAMCRARRARPCSPVPHVPQAPE
jgi:hypothetical protein